MLFFGMVVLWIGFYHIYKGFYPDPSWHVSGVDRGVRLFLQHRFFGFVCPGRDWGERGNLGLVAGAIFPCTGGHLDFDFVQIMDKFGGAFVFFDRVAFEIVFVEARR